MFSYRKDSPIVG